MTAPAQVRARPEQLRIAAVWLVVIDVAAGGDPVDLQAVDAEWFLSEYFLAKPLPACSAVPTANVDIRSLLLDVPRVRCTSAGRRQRATFRLRTRPQGCRRHQKGSPAWIAISSQMTHSIASSPVVASM